MFGQGYVDGSTGFDGGKDISVLGYSIDVKTLEVLLKQFGMSRTTFCTLFPQFTGLSLKQYLSRKRILEAEALIRSRPDLPLTEVAEKVGYDEISTFYRNFVRIAGVAPSKYKEICGGK